MVMRAIGADIGGVLLIAAGLLLVRFAPEMTEFERRHFHPRHSASGWYERYTRRSAALGGIVVACVGVALIVSRNL
jgi:UDP-N-acetylmuramyl pentapeptide phosphotransferase/UDP-N-acetylglucosamine-1-phosphate transferase